jgi:hypothetical protein
VPLIVLDPGVLDTARAIARLWVIHSEGSGQHGF